LGRLREAAFRRSSMASKEMLTNEGAQDQPLESPHLNAKGAAFEKRVPAKGEGPGGEGNLKPKSKSGEQGKRGATAAFTSSSERRKTKGEPRTNPRNPRLNTKNNGAETKRKPPSKGRGYRDRIVGGASLGSEGIKRKARRGKGGKPGSSQDVRPLKVGNKTAHLLELSVGGGGDSSQKISKGEKEFLLKVLNTKRK